MRGLEAGWGFYPVAVSGEQGDDLTSDEAGATEYANSFRLHNMIQKITCIRFRLSEIHNNQRLDGDTKNYAVMPLLV